MDMLFWIGMYLATGFVAGIAFLFIGYLVDADDDDLTLLTILRIVIYFVLGWPVILAKIVCFVVGELVSGFVEWADKTVVIRGKAKRNPNSSKG